MKKITLKLTESEFKTLSGNNLSHLGIGLLFTYTANGNKGIEVKDVDKFREFLKVDIADIIGICNFNGINLEEAVDYKDFKSILSKLDKEVKKVKKLDTYTEAMNDTPKNRRFQEIIDEINSLLPEYVKVYGFQDYTDKRNPNYVTVIALAFEGCPKHLIGGDNFSDSVSTSSSPRNLPEGAISNYLGMGMNGEIAGGYGCVEDELLYEMAKLKEAK
tara:strand:+ start:12882 stop:13532 length:651 start_codon:yes stop_codon:yes gene_type:complete